MSWTIGWGNCVAELQRTPAAVTQLSVYDTLLKFPIWGTKPLLYIWNGAEHNSALDGMWSTETRPDGNLSKRLGSQSQTLLMESQLIEDSRPASFPNLYSRFSCLPWSSSRNSNQDHVMRSRQNPFRLIGSSGQSQSPAIVLLFFFNYYYYFKCTLALFMVITDINRQKIAWTMDFIIRQCFSLSTSSFDTFRNITLSDTTWKANLSYNAD